MLGQICLYPPQNGGSLKEKQSFYEELRGEWDMHSKGDLVMCLGDINGHGGIHICGYNVIYGGYGVGLINFE